jgi:hypothetical protein
MRGTAERRGAEGSEPARTDRYYHRGQARTAIMIALLRSLDVPQPDVHELLVADDSRPVLF